MAKKNSSSLFNTIAPVYGLFYERQKKHFRKIIDNIAHELDLTLFETILDVGCGTGALCSVLNEKGLLVTGIDPAEKMISIAQQKPENQSISFMLADAVEHLPFKDESFDISIASHVAHGLQKRERKRLYTEMSRVTRNKVIIHDYNQNRALITSMIEWLERGDYFRFIKNAENEMITCISEMKECFLEVEVIDVAAHASWYICTPNR